MSQWILCDLCTGDGKVPKWDRKKQGWILVRCPVCKGRGWVKA